MSTTDEFAPLTPEELATEGVTALPDKEVVSILDLAADIDLAIDGSAIAARGPIMLADDGFKAQIGRSVRIGITRNADQRWRYFQRSSPFVSGPRSLNV